MKETSRNWSIRNRPKGSFSVNGCRLCFSLLWLSDCQTGTSLFSNWSCFSHSHQFILDLSSTQANVIESTNHCFSPDGMLNEELFSVEEVVPLVCWRLFSSPAVLLWRSRSGFGAEEPHRYLCRHPAGLFRVMFQRNALVTRRPPTRLFMCVQGYGFPVSRLFDLLFEVRDQYNETLLKKWALVFR